VRPAGGIALFLSSSKIRDRTIYRRGPWRSFEAVEFATLEWVDWFNNRRLLEPIGNIPPAEAEAAYYAQLEVMPMAA
jgi:putative transposase